MFKPKRLGASKPAAATNATLYAAPNTATGGAMAGTVTVCNQGTVNDQFRIALCLTGVSNPAVADYAYYDVTIAPKQTFAATLGWSLGQDERIVVRSLNGDCSFVVTGQEQA